MSGRGGMGAAAGAAAGASVVFSVSIAVALLGWTCGAGRRAEVV